MIEFIKDGDIFKSGCNVLVNPVNCVGAMGKGLALKFKKRYPDMFLHYKDACDKKLFQIGKVMIYDGTPKIILFPTKYHWRDFTRCDWIRDGLRDMLSVLSRMDVKSVAIPALGCGCGKAPWDVIKNIIEEELVKAPDMLFKVYTPRNPKTLYERICEMPSQHNNEFNLNLVKLMNEIADKKMK